jgi:hypothetical protein
MATIITVRVPVAPSLPIAPISYSGQHFDVHSNVLRLYFNQVDSSIRAIATNITTIATPSSGATAARPTTTLLVGQQYFDTTLGIPVWWNGSNWVNASGTTV